MSWKAIPALTGAADLSNLLILGSGALIGTALAFRPGRSFLSAGGDWALVLGQAAVLLFAKALFVWYGLAASCFLYVAAVRERRPPGLLPVVPLLASLALWVLQSGGWVGDSVALAVRWRSAAWAALLVGLSALAMRRMVGRRA